MEIQVLFFGISTDLVGETKKTYSLEEHASVKDLKKFLQSHYANLNNLNDFAIAVNEEYANDNLLLKDNDIIAIIPPVSGG
ncbi:molybdopterin converting factor subunit 1 [Lutibacter citreus]|uniref:molybdopterin converting factor subunit 1 n=1 Tax=Lutibacter citreus TaxID=2138210 RepID=UPI000DBE0F08|nr:molybdopterin converting factor subunit 1 [Lutibacter citreus]